MILKLDLHGKKLKLVVAEENEQAVSYALSMYCVAKVYPPLFTQFKVH